MSAKSFIKESLGCLPKFLVWNLIVVGLAMALTALWGGPRIYIELENAQKAALFLIILFAGLIAWSALASIKSRFKRQLAITEPYRYVRHPALAGILYLLNPALGILWRSWLVVLAVIPLYFIAKKCVRSTDARRAEKFGAAAENYILNTRRFFPNLYQINKLLFYLTAGAAVFAGTFIILNLPALSLRWVVYEKHNAIIYDTPVKTKSSFPDSNIAGTQNNITTNPADYNADSNAVIISKINVRAPLVKINGTSQNEINAGLDQGIILYPGSAQPGQNNEVVISGHSSVFPWVKTQYGQVFTLLDKLTAGDTVSIIYGHRQYDYLITDKEILNPSAVKVSSTNQATLKMITCWPIGTSAKRLVVYGELIK